MPKKKYYVVWEGHKTGIFSSWDKCKKAVEGYPYAKFKSFESQAMAEKPSMRALSNTKARM